MWRLTRRPITCTARSLFILNKWSNSEHGRGFDSLNSEQQAAMKQRLQDMIRRNTYDPATERLTVDPVRLEVFEDNLLHYTDVFANGSAEYAIQRGAQADPVKLRQMNAFFFWTAWASGTERPGSDVTYTNNWPPEKLIGNVPSTPNVVWSVASVILLIAGIAMLLWYHAATQRHEEAPPLPAQDPLFGIKLTPSMRATSKYFVTVIGLFLAQVGLGALTAHYAV